MIKNGLTVLSFVFCSGCASVAPEVAAIAGEVLISWCEFEYNANEKQCKIKTKPHGKHNKR